MIEKVKNIKLSVCVITYNHENYIRECLQSILDQKTNFDFEIIVGDDCSTDGTRLVVQEFTDRYPYKIRAIFQPMNTGGSRNNLEVHAAANGEYVAHLDGDDYALPGKLQAQVDILDQDIACNAVWHRVDFFDAFGGFCSGFTSNINSFADGVITFKDAIRLGNVGIYSSMMYRRGALTQLDCSREILDFYLAWDLLSKGGHGRIIDNVLGRYRVGVNGSLTQKNKKKADLLAIAHVEEFSSRHPGYIKDFAIWGFTNALIALKQRKISSLYFVLFLWRLKTIPNPVDIFLNLLRMKSLQVQWRSRLTHARHRKD